MPNLFGILRITLKPKDVSIIKESQIGTLNDQFWCWNRPKFVTYSEMIGCKETLRGIMFSLFCDAQKFAGFSQFVRISNIISFIKVSLLSKSVSNKIEPPNT